MSNENEQPLDTASPRPSGLGKASVVLGLIVPAVMILCGCVFPFAMLALGEQGDSDTGHLLSYVALLGFLASPIASLTGICLAVAGLFSRNVRRRTSVAGVVLNVLALSVFVLMCLWWSAAIDDMIAC